MRGDGPGGPDLTFSGHFHVRKQADDLSAYDLRTERFLNHKSPAALPKKWAAAELFFDQTGS